MSDSPTPARARLQLYSALRILCLTAAICGIGGGLWCLMTPVDTTELERTAVQAIERKDLTTADRVLQQVLSHQPRNADILRLLADIAHRRGREAECVQWLTRHAEISDRPAQAFVAAAARAFELHQVDAAEMLYLQASAADHKALRAYGGLGRLYLAIRRPSALQQMIHEADGHGAPLDQEPTLLWMDIIGDRVSWQTDDAEQWLVAASQKSPQHPWLAAALAKTYCRSSRQADAERLIARFDSSAANWPVRLVEIQSRLQAGQVAQATALLNQLPPEAEADPLLWLLCCELSSQRGEWGQALLMVDAALVLDPLSVEAATVRGRILSHLNRPAEAETQLRRAARMDELVRCCLQLLQSSKPAVDDALRAAAIAQELGLKRWAFLVCQWIERQPASVAWPASLEGLRHETQIDRLPLLPTTAPRLRPRFSDPPATAAPPPTPTAGAAVNKGALRLTNVAKEMGLEFVYEHGHAPERWLMETLGGGVATLDYDRDGWLDLFFAQGGPLTHTAELDTPGGCRLFRNHQGERFADVTGPARGDARGYVHGCAVGDLNEDGFHELVLCGYGCLTLLWNQGDGTWLDGTSDAGLTASTWSTTGICEDFDRDGDLDLYVAGYCHAPLSASLRTCRDSGNLAPCRPGAYPAEPDQLWENLGDGRFANCSKTGGIDVANGYGLGVVAADFDNDQRTDIFVGNDTTPNFMFWNRGRRLNDPAGLFTEGGLAAGVGVDGDGRAEACMGIACGDIDGNGLLDLFVTNFHDETCTLYVNQGQRLFADQTVAAGLSNAGRCLMGWGTQFVDLDADGWLDLAILNGHLHDQGQRPQLYRNQGGRFTECSATAGGYFQTPILGRSLAVGDFDRDGRDDLAASHQAEPAAVLRNDTVSGGSVHLELVGQISARDATGTMVRSRVGKLWQTRLMTRQGGYLSSSSGEVLIGLGSAKQIDELEILWPSGSKQKWTALPKGRRLQFREGAEPRALLQ